MFFTGLEDKYIIRDFIKKNGFIVLQNALNATEVEMLPNFFGKIFEENKLTLNTAEYLPGASHLDNRFIDLICSKKLISVLKKICSEDLVYTSHSDLQSGVAGDWHKDDGKGKYFEGLKDYFSNHNVEIYKVGFYLQDCTSYGGLTVKKSSHLVDNKKDGEEIYIPCRVSDAVIFDVRITHRGWLPKDNNVKYFLKKILRRLKLLPSTPKVPFVRKSIFFTYGSDNDYTKVFSKKNMERQIRELGFDISQMPDKMKKLLTENKIKFY
jgi:hypothetical protein